MGVSTLCRSFNNTSVAMHKWIQIILPIYISLNKNLQLPTSCESVPCTEICLLPLCWFQSIFSKRIMISFRASQIILFQVERIRKPLIPAGVQSMLKKTDLQSFCIESRQNKGPHFEYELPNEDSNAIYLRLMFLQFYDLNNSLTK